MLVLSRKVRESIVVGDGILTVFVVEIRGDKVRLGFEAPKDLPIHRREVYEAAQRQKKREESEEAKADEQKTDTP